MSEAVIASFLLYAFVAASTPGPNNILILNAMINYGFRQSGAILLGVYVGFAVIMVPCEILSNVLLVLLKEGILYLKILGIAYILYLAYKIALSKPPNTTNDDERLGFWASFFLQFVNVKIILYGISIQTTFVFPYDTSLLMSVIFVLLSIIIGYIGLFFIHRGWSYA